MSALSNDSNNVDDDYTISSLEDACYGLTVGAAIGDSIGSYLEFSNGNALDDVIEHAMTMPGGGTWGSRVKTGQVTDDTELAVSLAKGLYDMILINNEKQQIYDSHYAAKQYKKWYGSGPFDIGGCTSSTLSESPNVEHMKKAADDYNKMMANQYKSSGNLANGSLMRCMPLIVYGHKLSKNDLFEIMKEDSSLTHANYIVYYINSAYAIAAQYLLNNDIKQENKNDDDDDNGDDLSRNKMAFLKAEEWLKSELIKHKFSSNNECISDVYKWLLDCKLNDISKLQPANRTIGFLKIAFQRAFFHLYNNTNFETSIKMTLCEGGDTDTNCCIVGGLIGANFGLKGIPQKFINNILNCKPAVPIRDNQFQAKWYIKSNGIKEIIKYAPNTIKIKYYKPQYSDDEDNDYNYNNYDDDYNPDEEEEEGKVNVQQPQLTPPPDDIDNN